MKYLVLDPPQPEYDTMTFDYDKAGAAVARWSKLADAKDADISKFHKRGGKLIMLVDLSTVARSAKVEFVGHALRSGSPSRLSSRRPRRTRRLRPVRKVREVRRVQARGEVAAAIRMLARPTHPQRAPRICARCSSTGCGARAC